MLSSMRVRMCALTSLEELNKFASAFAGTQLSLKLLQLLPLVKARHETRHCACNKRLLHPSLYHCE